MTHRITITAGLGIDLNGQLIPKESAIAAIESIRKHIASATGGFTETPANGGWVNRNGELLQEPSIRWITLADNDDKAQELAYFAAKALNQESVLLEVEEVRAHVVESLTTLEKFERLEADADRVLN